MHIDKNSDTDRGKQYNRWAKQTNISRNINLEISIVIADKKKKTMEHDYYLCVTDSSDHDSHIRFDSRIFVGR